MIILDAHLSPSLAVWINESFNIPCFSASYLNLKESSDLNIFFFAKKQNAIVITKDSDFLILNKRFGSPPKVTWLTCGNTSVNKMKEIFEMHLMYAIQTLENESIIEISK